MRSRTMMRMRIKVMMTAMKKVKKAKVVMTKSERINLARMNQCKTQLAGMVGV